MWQFERLNFKISVACDSRNRSYVLPVHSPPSTSLPVVCTIEGCSGREAWTDAPLCSVFTMIGCTRPRQVLWCACQLSPHGGTVVWIDGICCIVCVWIQLDSLTCFFSFSVAEKGRSFSFLPVVSFFLQEMCFCCFKRHHLRVTLAIEKLLKTEISEKKQCRVILLFKCLLQTKVHVKGKNKDVITLISCCFLFSLFCFCVTLWGFFFLFHVSTIHVQKTTKTSSFCSQA